MNATIKRFYENQFFRSIATLMSGTIIAQIIGFLSSPLMTRLYTEEQIGEYTLLLTVVTMFGPVICGRYDMAIVGEQSEKNMYSLIKLSFFLTIGMSFIVGIAYAIYFCASGSTELSFMQVLLWILAFLFATGFLNILHSYNNKYRDYKLMAKASVCREIGRSTALVALGAAHTGAVGLMIAYVTSGIMELWQQIKRLKNNIESIKSVTFKDMRHVAGKHIRQPVFSVPAIFANSFSYSVINIFINGLFGAVSLAYYSMSYRMLGIPLSLISNSTSKAYFEKAAREQNQTGCFSKTFIQTSLFLAAIAIPMTAALMLLAPWAFAIFFGKSWRISGLYVRYLAPMFGFRLVVSPLTPTMIIVNKQKSELILQISFVAATCAAYMLGKYTNSIELFLTGITVLFAIIYIVYYLYMLKLSFKKGEVRND